MTSSDPHDERTVRESKLHGLRAIGVKLYPDRFAGKEHIADICKKYEKKELRTIEEIISGPDNTVHTAGRIMLMRSF